MSIEAILESIEKLTLLEAAELVKAMEEKFGVSAAAPVAVAAAPAAAAAPAGRVRRKAGVQPNRLCCGTLGGQPDERGGGTSAGRPGAGL